MEPCRKRSRYNEACISFPPSLKDWDGIELKYDLYPSILLHLGYLAAPEDRNENNGDVDPLVNLLCQHWEKLASSQIFNSDLELSLATNLLSTINHRTTIISILNVVLINVVSHPASRVPQNLLKSLIPHLKINDTAFRILRHQSKETMHASSLFTAAYVVLKKAIFEEGINKKLLTLSEVIVSGLDCTMPLNENCEIKLFLWALCHFSEYALYVAKRDQILDYLTDEREADTLSLLAKFFPSDKFATRLETIYLCPDLDHRARDHALLGLISLADKLTVSDSLLDAITTATKENSSQNLNAVTLLVRLHEQKKIPTGDILHLLKTTDINVAEPLVMSVAQQHDCFLKHPSLLFAMAKLVTKFSSQPMRLALLRTVETLASHQCYWSDLARNVPMISILVGLIDQDPMPPMEILWKLSTPVWNRRILAKQPGLLPKCIRWARSLPVTDPQRNKWKSRLDDLASVL
jgi:hypothetical protein